MDDAINILCPGPSLGRTPLAPARLTIAVNRAAVWPCDWWCFVDPEGLLGVFAERKGKMPGVCTTKRTRDAVRVMIEKSPLVRLVEELGDTIPYETNWHRHTMTTAMVLAEEIGAKHVRIYGCDWAGDRYFDGTPDSLPHQERFKAEIHVYGHVTAWLAKRGVSCERVAA